MTTTHEINGYEFELKPGMRVTVDGNSVSRELKEGDEFCPFRIESCHAPKGIACRVEVTGRSIRWVPSKSVRVKITTVHEDPAEVERFSAWLWL